MSKGTCPICNGTTRVPAGDAQHKIVLSSYDPETDTLACGNCGRQYMYGRATGEVNLNSDGEPCVHTYTLKTIGRCLTKYTCLHCADCYEIDSGD